MSEQNVGSDFVESSKSSREYALRIPEGFPIPEEVGIDQEKFEKWRNALQEIRAVHPVWLKVWESIANNIDFITFEDFISQVAKQIAYVAEYVEHEHITMTYLVVPDHLDSHGKKIQTPSEYWIASLIASNAPFDLRIVEKSDFIQQEQKWDTLSSGFSTLVLYADDCLYTGNQAGKRMGQSWRRMQSDCHVKVMIPFMSLGGKDTFLDLSGFEDDTLVPFRRILQFRDFIPQHISANDLEFAQHMLEDVLYTGDVSVASQTLTYFAHKMPDFISFPEQVVNGNVAWSSGVGHYSHGRYDESYPFLPKIRAPYHNWVPDWLRSQTT